MDGKETILKFLEQVLILSYYFFRVLANLVVLSYKPLSYEKKRVFIINVSENITRNQKQV